jgi:hypothetical protein
MAWRRPHTSGNPNTRKVTGKEHDVTITWKNPQEGYGLPLRQKPATYRDAVALKHDTRTRLQAGAMFFLTRDMCLIDDPAYPFPSLVPAYRGQPVRTPVRATKGSVLLCSGSVRVKERANVAGELREVEVPKQVFVVPGVGRCIVHGRHLVHLKPA